MTFKDLSKWNTRMSAVYAAGVWTMLCSYAYYSYTGRYDKAVKEEVEPEPENPNQFVYESAHSKTIIVYKENFVPYTTRIYNFVKSFSSGPESGGSEK
ncbi:small integral membrane protein 26-like [Scomber japonicus]|uniref:small integral membrane protein 26-like n=1 Tax=Scomber japonicus TaxID=13676 RepID=UPI0023054286|nr:small integral membrane protein 26-like [Scomber japonicus]